MSEIANKFLLASDKYMPEMHLKQPGYTYSACGQFTKNKERKSILRDKAFKIASDPEHDGYQRGLASMVYKFFDKKSSGNGLAVSLANKSATTPNY